MSESRYLENAKRIAAAAQSETEAVAAFIAEAMNDRWESPDAYARAAITALDQHREGKGYGEGGFSAKLSADSIRMRAALDSLRIVEGPAPEGTVWITPASPTKEEGC